MDINPISSSTKAPLTFRRLRAKAAAALLLYLGISPLFLLPGVYFAPDFLAEVLLLPLAALALTYAAGLLSSKKRSLAFAAALLFQAILYALVFLPRHPLAMLLYLPSFVVMLLFMPAMARPSGMEWSGQMLLFGVIAHIVGQILKGMAEFSIAGSLLTLFFSIYLLSCLFVINRLTLLDGLREKQSPPVKILSQNRRLVALLGILALLAAGWRSLRDVLLVIVDFVKRILITVVLFLMGLFPSMQPAEGPSGGQGLDLNELGESGTPSTFSVILEKILIFIGFSFLLVLILYGFYHISKLIKKAVLALMKHLKNYTRSISEGYTDQTENLFDLQQVSKTVKDKWASMTKRSTKLPPLQSLAPRERIRRVYAMLLGRMKDTASSLTAREALEKGGLNVTPEQAKTMAALYEQARYSDQPITSDQAETMQKNAGI